MASCLLPLALASEPQSSVQPIDWNSLTSLRKSSQSVRQASLGANPRPVWVFTGDWIIPHFADGGPWQTSIVLTNFSNFNARLSVFFMDANGDEMKVPINGYNEVSALQVSISPNNTVQFESTGTAPNLKQGWVLILPSGTEKFSGFGILRQRVAGRPDFEAVVPLSSAFEAHTMLLFDNTRGFVVGMAIVNTDVVASKIKAIIRAHDGTLIAEKEIQLGSFSHTAFNIKDQWPETANLRGSIEFISDGESISVLGLRFHPDGAFTSFHSLTNVDWIIGPI